METDHTPVCSVVLGLDKICRVLFTYMRHKYKGNRLNAETTKFNKGLRPVIQRGKGWQSQPAIQSEIVSPTEW